MKKLLVQTIVELILIINAWLTLKGINPIPFDESQLTEFFTYIIGGAATLYAMWKNHNFSKAAKEGQRLTDAIKAGLVPAEVFIGGELSNDNDPEEV